MGQLVKAGGDSDLILAKVDQARLLLASAKDAPEAKKIADVARAAEVYAKRQKLSEEVIQYAHAVKVDALTLMGEFLKAVPKATGGEHGGKRSRLDGSRKEPSNPTPTLAEVGIGRKESADAQALAALKAEAPDAHEKVRQGELTISAGVAVIRRQKADAKKAKVASEAKGSEELNGKVFRVEQGDCLEWLRDQPADSVHLIFGSPPYENARLYLEGGENLGIARDVDAWVSWMVEVYKASLHCCTGLVAFVVEGRTTNYRWSASPALLMAALVQEGIHIRKPPIYHRVGIPGSGGPDWLRNDYEFIICATRGGQLPWSENTAMGRAPKFAPGGNPTHRTQDGSRVNGQSGYATMEDRNNTGPHRARQRAGRVYQPPEVANPGNLISCVVGGGNMGDKISHENEAPFPEYLPEFFIRSFCPPGGVVCDPFSGSGTTGAVAVRHGRRFVGCDLRASQVKLSMRRIAKVQPLLPIIGE